MLQQAQFGKNQLSEMRKQMDHIEKKLWQLQANMSAVIWALLL